MGQAEQPAIDAWGVFRQLSDDGDEYLCHVHDDARTAMLTLGKMVCFRGFGDMGNSDFHKMVDTVTELVLSGDTEKAIKAENETYYVRELTREEIEGILQDDA